MEMLKWKEEKKKIEMEKKKRMPVFITGVYEPEKPKFLCGEVQQLQVQLLASQSNCEGNVAVGTEEELRNLINQIHTSEDENDKLTRALQAALDENTNMDEKAVLDAMALQKTCQERRKASKDMGNVTGRLKYWLDGELEVVFAKNQAQKSLQNLI